MNCMATEHSVIKLNSTGSWYYCGLRLKPEVDISSPANECSKIYMRPFLLFLLSLTLISCLGIPKGVVTVKDFDETRYLGKWYEIARLDHSFERGLSKVMAEYELRGDGGIKVINRGFSIAENKWKEAEGKAYFVGDRNEGYLKVSFFGPFYGSYIIFDLDQENYQYAFISGYNTSYLWLLSRTPTVSKEIKEQFVKKSKELGFDTDGLIFAEGN